MLEAYPSAVVVAACLLVAACGRSEQVGWEGREPPDSAERVAMEAAAAESLKRTPMGLEMSARAHQQLAQQLDSIRQRAMQDSQLAAMWEDLAGDVEAKIIAGSPFHEKLVDRRDEIEALLGRDGGSADTLTDQQKAELGRNHWNIQVEMARVRNIELRQPEFFPRLREFRAALFDKMREIAPERAPEIDRMEELEGEIIEPAPEAPVPGMSPAR